MERLEISPGRLLFRFALCVVAIAAVLTSVLTSDHSQPAIVDSRPSLLADAVREGSPGLREPRPILATRLAPTYPSIAMRAKFGGSVHLRVLVGSDGHVQWAQIRRGLGRFSLDEHALASVMDWEFEPGTLGSRPVAVLISTRVDFKPR